MPRSPRPILLAALASLLPGCQWLFGSGLRYTDNPYTSYSGYETFVYGFGDVGVVDCDMIWAVSGAAVAIPETCVSCDFNFVVTRAYDAGPYAGQSAASEACSDLAVSDSFTYAYSEAYGSILLGYYDYYVPWLPATFEPPTFTYGGGVVDYEMSEYGYAGVYYTYYWAGQATVK